MRLLPIIFIFLLFSCNKKDQINNQYDRLSDKGLYSKFILGLNHSDSLLEDYELYITKNRDTFYNQYKVYKNGVLDTLNSIYYSLDISKTDKPNTYKGIITLHSKYENIKLNESIRREVQFGYCVQNKDSIDIVYLESKTENTFEFEYENYYNHKLQGILYQIVLRDTIVDNEEYVNINRIYLLVDNDTLTDNLFLESYEIPKTKKFSFDKKSFVKDN